MNKYNIINMQVVVNNNRSVVNQFSDDICTVCYIQNLKKIQFYKCLKYHNLCESCFDKSNNITNNNDPDDSDNDTNKNTNDTNTCPTCRSSINLEFKHPSKLTLTELSKINLTLIRTRYIFIHQNFELLKKNKFAKILSDKNDLEIVLKKGTFATFLGLYVAKNGFLYDYNTDHDIYYPAVHRGKFQFWDISKVSIDLS